jgi:hypothetical protein
MNILQRVLIANTILIGYDTQNEISVQKLLRFLPSVTLFESTEASEILQHFNSLSHFRDYKLNSLLNDNTINYIVVDLSTIYFNEERETGDKYQETFSKAKSISKFVKELQSLLFTLSNTDSPIIFKLILLTGIYSTMTPTNAQVEFKGGMTLMYVADLVLKFLGDTVSIEKDRITDNRYINNTTQELREISIQSLFDEITTTT